MHNLKAIISSLKITFALMLVVSFASMRGAFSQSTAYYISHVSAVELGSGNEMVTGCWAAPNIPELVYPLDGSVASASSDWIANPYMDWQVSTSSCPDATIQYQYESYRDAGLTLLAYQSAWLNNDMIPAPGTPDGDYYWRVRARDQHGHQSEFSGAWKLTVDRSTPAPELLTLSLPTETVEEMVVEETPAPVIETPEATPSSILLNEVLPDPTGNDRDPKPMGEWVELYNNSSSDIDVAGWIITNSAGSSVTITTGLTTTGSTVVPQSGFLVIYLGETDIELQNAGDTVSLYQSAVLPENLKDVLTYTLTPEGKSIARIPDGSPTWVDPIPTPGFANVTSLDELEASVKLIKTDETHLGLQIIGALNYKQAQYAISYTHLVPGQENPLTEGIVGKVDIKSYLESVNQIFLGTASTGVEKPHTGIGNVSVDVTLTGENIPDRLLKATLAP